VGGIEARFEEQQIDAGVEQRASRRAIGVPHVLARAALRGGPTAPATKRGRSGVRCDHSVAPRGQARRGRADRDVARVLVCAVRNVFVRTMSAPAAR
jgi:hypothetical protein